MVFQLALQMSFYYTPVDILDNISHDDYDVHDDYYSAIYGNHCGSNDNDDNNDLTMNAQITYTCISTHTHGGVVNLVFR